MEKVTLTAILVLAVVQGFTEFLPISSSAHLVFAQSLLGIRKNVLALDIVLHVGTLAAVLLVFRQDLMRMITGLKGCWQVKRREKILQENVGVRMIYLIIVASVPTGLIGIIFHDEFEAQFGQPDWVGLQLVVTGIFLWASGLIRQSKNLEVLQTKTWMALVVGVVQGISIIPGISRSGATLVACLFLGLQPSWSARFSFLLAIPAITGAALLEMSRTDLSQMNHLHLGLGFLTAMALGIISLYWVVSTLKKGTFRQFHYYAIPVGFFFFVYFHYYRP